MYEKDDGSYQMFDDDLSAALSYASRKGADAIVEQQKQIGKSVVWDIDLEKMTMMNTLTKSVVNMGLFDMRNLYAIGDMYAWRESILDHLTSKDCDVRFEYLGNRGWKNFGDTDRSVMLDYLMRGRVRFELVHEWGDPESLQRMSTKYGIDLVGLTQTGPEPAATQRMLRCVAFAFH